MDQNETPHSALTMAFKIFVLIASLTVATCSPLLPAMYDAAFTHAMPNFLPRFPFSPFNFPGRNIYSPSTTVCESAGPQLMTPTTTVCESNSMPNVFPLQNGPSTTVCESSQVPFNPFGPVNPPTTTVCESSPTIPSMYSGGCGCPNLAGLGMPNLGLALGMPMSGLGMPMSGLGMPMSGLGIPSLLMNGLGMSPKLGLAGLINMGLPMPVIATLLSCLGIM